MNADKFADASVTNAATISQLAKTNADLTTANIKLANIIANLIDPNTRDDTITKLQQLGPISGGGEIQ